VSDIAAKRGLGRGLSALLGDVEPVTRESERPRGAETGARTVPIELLRRNPDQPRRNFNDEELEELAASIRERGILQPILVRPAPGAPGEFQIVAGERRWRASQRAGLHVMPVMVRELDDAAVAEIAIVENIQRAELNPVEEAFGYRTLMEKYGRTQEQIAQSVGKSRSHVANTMRLLALPDGVRDHLVSGRLSAGHARAIATAPDPEALAHRIVGGDLSVRQAETLAREAANRPAPEPKAQKPAQAAGKDADTRALEQDLSEILGLTVEILDRKGQGEVRIGYATLEQLDEICRRLSA